MSIQDVRDKYEWIKRLEAFCTLAEGAMATGATRSEDLPMPAIMAQLDDYHKETLGMIQPDFLSACLKPKNRNGLLYHVLALHQYLNDFCDRIDRGYPVLYHYFTMTPELFWGFDCAPICYELLPVYSSAIFNEGMTLEIDFTEEMGYPHHLCSAQKGGYAAIVQGSMPKPDVMIKQSTPCDPSSMVFQLTAKKYGVPIVCLDTPYYTNDRALNFYRSEWHNMANSLEMLLHCELDVDRLRRHVEWGNQAMAYYYKMENLRKVKPCPDPGMHRPFDTASLIMMGSNPKFIDYFKIVSDEAEDRTNRGEGVIPEGIPEIRTLWGYAWQAWDLGMLDWLEEEYGHTYLTCGVTYFPEDLAGYVDTSTRDTMIDGLATRGYYFPMARQPMSFADIWVNDFVKLAKEYSADACVFAGHMACKHFWALNKLLSDALMEKAGVPTLRFETDLLDYRFTPKSEVHKYMEDFFGALGK